MKKTALFSILFLSLFVVSTLSFTGNKKVITVVFNKEMTKRDLMNLQKNLKEKNIVLVFNEIKFNRKKLAYIDFSIDFGDGFAGSSKSIIGKNKEIGFIRNYDEDADQPFVIGVLK